MKPTLMSLPSDLIDAAVSMVLLAVFLFVMFKYIVPLLLESARKGQGKKETERREEGEKRGIARQEMELARFSYQAALG